MSFEFNPKIDAKIRQSMEAQKSLESLFPAWRGTDIMIKENQIIPARGVVKNVPLIVTKENLPPIPMNRGALGVLSLSVRSFFAQSGIDIKFSAYDVPDEEIQKLAKGEPATIPIHVSNYSGRPVTLHDGVMRFFWVDFSKRLQGDALRNAIDVQEIKITGTEGKDWLIDDVAVDPEDKLAIPGESRTQVDIRLNLNDNKYYIPPSNEPVYINSRKELANVHQPIPKDMMNELDFKIGETPFIELGENMIGVIDTGAHDGTSSRHIASPLIDPGFSGPIRTEIYNDQEFIHLSLFRVKE